MAIHEDVEVKITLKPAPDPTRRLDPPTPGEALKEYDDPDPLVKTPGLLMEKYIEAIPGREFQVEIYLQPSFNMFDADDLAVHLTIDYDTVKTCILYDKPRVLYNMAHERPCILRDVYDYNNTTEHSRISFSFASLEGGE